MNTYGDSSVSATSSSANGIIADGAGDTGGGWRPSNHIRLPGGPSAAAETTSLTVRLDGLDYLNRVQAAAEIRFQELYDQAREIDGEIDGELDGEIDGEIDGELDGDGDGDRTSPASTLSQTLYDSFAKNADAWLKAAPDAASRAELGDILTAIADRGRLRVAALEQHRRGLSRARHAEALLDAYVEGAAADPDAALSYLASGDQALDRSLEMGALASAVDRRRSQFHTDLAGAAIHERAAADPDRAVADLAAGAFDQLFINAEPGLKSALAADARILADSLAQADQADEASRAEHVIRQTDTAAHVRALAFIAEFDAALAANTAKPSDIAGAEFRGLIDTAEAQRLQARLTQARQRVQARARLVVETGRRLDRGEPFDPGNGADHAALNAYYDDIFVPALARSGDRQPAADALAKRTRMLPTAMIKDLHRALIAGDPADLARTAARLKDLSTDPALFDQLAQALPAAGLIRARAISLYTDLNLAPDQTVKLGDDRLADGAEKLKQTQKIQPAQQAQQAKAQKTGARALDLRGRLSGTLRSNPQHITQLAASGRFGDTEIGHLTPGEMVLPQALLTPDLKVYLQDAFRQAGLDIGRYIVGGTDDSINPATGAREFFFSDMDGGDWDWFD